jgi:hypothetical protein
MNGAGNVIAFPSPTSPDDRAAKTAAQVDIFAGAPIPFFNASGPVSALDKLPFVTWAPAGNYWNDEPTDDGGEDFQRGRRFARAALEAVRSDIAQYGTMPVVIQLTARRIELILESMIRDGIRRHKKGGPGSRTVLTSSMQGFLTTFTKVAVCLIVSEESQ